MGLYWCHVTYSGTQLDWSVGWQKSRDTVLTKLQPQYLENVKIETEIKAALQLCVCRFMYIKTQIKNTLWVSYYSLTLDVFVSDLKFANHISKVTRIYFYRQKNTSKVTFLSETAFGPCVHIKQVRLLQCCFCCCCCFL